MPRTNKHRLMERVITEAKLPERELIRLLALYMTDSDPEKIEEWLGEIKFHREELERRSSALLQELTDIEIRRFDPVI